MYHSEKNISVIIPNYNYGRFIGEAIESALVQTLSPAEVIVVDDGSTDDSVKVVESFGEKVKLIRQQNGGVGKARNVGAAGSKGEFLAFLDADDIWVADKLRKQMSFFEDASVGYVSCGMREFDVEGKTIAEYVPSGSDWTAENLLLFNAPIVASGSAFVVRKSVFEQIKGFDENPHLHPSEDWDFAYRALKAARVTATPELLVNYRNHGNNGHLKIPRFERSMLLAFDKAFDKGLPKNQAIKKQAYGNLHKILAGSYFQAGDYSNFVRHSVKSIQNSPSSLAHFLTFPLRRLKRAIS